MNLSEKIKGHQIISYKFEIIYYLKNKYILFKNKNNILYKFIFNMGIGDWGLGIGDWGLGIGPNPQSPIPNPQSPIPNPQFNLRLIKKLFKIKKIIKISKFIKT